MDKETKEQEDPFHILTTTFVIMGLVLLLWVLVVILSQDEEINILEEINNS